MADVELTVHCVEGGIDTFSASGKEAVVLAQLQLWRARTDELRQQTHLQLMNLTNRTQDGPPPVVSFGRPS